MPRPMQQSVGGHLLTLPCNWPSNLRNHYDDAPIMTPNNEAVLENTGILQMDSPTYSKKILFLILAATIFGLD
jgi:hypothetical protein